MVSETESDFVEGEAVCMSVWGGGRQRWDSKKCVAIWQVIWGNISIRKAYGEEIFCYIGVFDPELVVFFEL